MGNWLALFPVRGSFRFEEIVMLDSIESFFERVGFKEGLMMDGLSSGARRPLP